MSRRYGDRAAQSRPPTQWGCECEQEAGAPRSGDTTVRESLAATGKDFVCDDNASTTCHEAMERIAGGDRRMTPAADNVTTKLDADLSEAAV